MLRRNKKNPFLKSTICAYCTNRKGNNLQGLPSLCPAHYIGIKMAHFISSTFSRNFCLGCIIFKHRALHSAAVIKYGKIVQNHGGTAYKVGV